MTVPHVLCSDGARRRGDALAGTGSRGMRWLLIEVDGAWGHSAFLDSPTVLNRELGYAIVRRAEAADMRTLAIRRPGRARGEGRWRWAVVDSRPGFDSVRWGEASEPEELLEIPLDGSTGVASDIPVVAVCTHGRHDRCCAVRGRQVLPALMSRHPDLTWECSHLGGDRFAGTMILFPQGMYYGNVDDADAAHIVDRHLLGLVEPQFLRGRSSLPPEVQVAQVHAREFVDDHRIDALQPVSVARDGTLWTVTLDHDGAAITVTLREGVSDPITTTCTATRAGTVRTFDLAAPLHHS